MMAWMSVADLGQEHATSAAENIVLQLAFCKLRAATLQDGDDRDSREGWSHSL